ncbi:MAG: CopG family antitoxin [Verrucomicrobia bacterium]|nr:CopG family antitoxin [Verrucomicrobiota bacterium]MDA1067864.1 CopG family antitoxin [Verrucomicrobiota bacterium]
MKALKLDQEEKELLEELERDEWVSTLASPKDFKQFQEAAKNTLKKDKRVNIRISERDLSSIQKIALEEGIPYQTLISSVLHKYVNKKIKV